ncbi:hypothetical protein [Clostridium sp.]|uniref:hypothetical protein n=1 Tax=Clostridium sp. TaxID=1506 RepID=UPI0025B99E4A|nr:hypothetical protein [Clostridium sp.]
MAIKKFENINIKKDIKKEKVKLTKEEKKLLKEKKKLKKKELKEIRKEDKKVLLTTKELLPFKDADDDDSIITKMGHIDIFQIDSKDIYSLNEIERKMHIYSFVSFLRGYVYDFKLISMKFPVNTLKQQRFLEKKLKECDNEIYANFLKEKLDQLIFLEENRQNKEFYIMIFIKDTDNKEEVKGLLLRNQNIAIQLKPLDIEKKLKILFKLNNPNTKLM